MTGAAPELTYTCPYCGEPGFTLAETDELGQPLEPELLEDCRVCCRPVRLCFEAGPDGDLAVAALAEDE